MRHRTELNLVRIGEAYVTFCWKVDRYKATLLNTGLGVLF